MRPRSPRSRRGLPVLYSRWKFRNWGSDDALGAGAELSDAEVENEDDLEFVARPVAVLSFRHLLGSSLLWAIPVSYLACSVSVTVAMVIGMLGDGDDASSFSFVSTVLVGFFLWGTMIFVATSYITIPALTVTIAAVRYALRRLRAELPG